MERRWWITIEIREQRQDKPPIGLIFLHIQRYPFQTQKHNIPILRHTNRYGKKIRQAKTNKQQLHPKTSNNTTWLINNNNSTK